MVSRLKRRMRCEVQSCKNEALYGLGVKGIDYPLCEMHLKELVDDGVKIFYPVQEKATDAEVEMAAAEPVQSVQEATNEEEQVNTPNEYYECKYCGEKFLKSEITAGQFGGHVRRCKKEHEA